MPRALPLLPILPKKRCDVAANLGEPLLPVAGTGFLSQIRSSRTSRWRASVLIGLHLIVVLHVAHYMVRGRTVSPVEPSESMYTLELGYLNAGFIFFIISLLATLVFGRFFCGWACHLVALQDLCGWIMKTLGIRPRPFRSRLLVFAPFALAFYMFFWPTILRLAAGDPAPGLTNHLVTTSFWATFPGPVFTVLTFLVCGFLAVYLLGSKGFCTYACPYGAFFLTIDRFSAGRIVVNDSCEQCGHCTATCTSNVRVHEEVRLYGMVVDPGCMKCMDCVSVCPKGALSFGFAVPSIFKARGAARSPKVYDLALPEEIVAALLCFAASLAFRGLYDGPPLLLSVCLGALTAFTALRLWHLAARPTVRLQNLPLKLGGSIRPAGVTFALLGALWILFAAHSGFVQWHRAWGRFHLDRTEAARADVLSGAFREKTYSTRHRTAAERSFRHLSIADRWGLGSFVDVKLGLAWGRLLQGDMAGAELDAQSATALAPANPDLRDNLVQIRLARGDAPGAIEALRAKRTAAPLTAADHFLLAGLLVESDRTLEAVAEYEACLALAPGSPQARYNLGGLLRRLGRNAEAIEHLGEAVRLLPEDPAAFIELGLALLAQGNVEGAIAALQQATILDPDSPEATFHLRPLLERLARERGHPLSPAAPPAQ